MTGEHFTYDIESIIQTFLDEQDEHIYFEVHSPDALVGTDTPVAFWCTTVKVRVDLFRSHGKHWMACSFLLVPGADKNEIRKLLRKALVSFTNEIKQRDTLLAKKG